MAQLIRNRVNRSRTCQLIFLLLLIPFLSAAQPDGRSIVEVPAGLASLKKPPSYPTGHNPCVVVFENYTNSPMQVSRVREDGKVEKLYYMDAKDTISFATMTNYHLIVVFNGYTAGPMFLPYGDVNICKVHDKHFNQTIKVSPKKYFDPRLPVKEDNGFKYKPPFASYGKGKGPVIYFDQAHLNPYRIDCNFTALRKMLEKDGYDVRPYRVPFTEKGLNTGEILVIGNAIAPQVNGWRLDSAQAFTTEERLALVNWVKSGGTLLLIADEPPYPDRIKDLASDFGFKFAEGTAIDTSQSGVGTIVSRAYGTLNKHITTEGRNDNEVIDQLAVFRGSAFQVPQGAKSIITLNDKFRFFGDDPLMDLTNVDIGSAEGFSMAATMSVGDGKIAVFGDIEMLGAFKTIDSGDKIGMNWKYANENATFVMNIFHWLDGFIE